MRVKIEAEIGVMLPQASRAGKGKEAFFPKAYRVRTVLTAP